jgi:hypothetical protein
METKKFFEKEDEFLKLLYDKEGKLFSKSRIFARVKITPELLIEKKFNLEYCDINMYDEGLIYTDAILKNKSGFYVYLSRKDSLETYYQIKVYFEPNKIEETKFFIKSLLKLKENDGN